MYWIMIGVLVLLGILKILSFRPVKSGKRSIGFPYNKNPNFLTPAESSFFRVLEKAVGDKLRVFVKVRMADVIKVRYGLSRMDKGIAFNKIKSKHLDFVVCGAEDLDVRFAVELDDSSHRKSNRQDRDKFVDKALDAAGVPIFHFDVKRAYSMQELRDVIFKKPEEE